MKTKDVWPNMHHPNSFVCFDDEHPSKDPTSPTGHRYVGLVETVDKDPQNAVWHWSLLAPLAVRQPWINGKSKSRGEAGRMLAEAYRQWLRAERDVE
jgi:hypothetical protein